MVCAGTIILTKSENEKFEYALVLGVNSSGEMTVCSLYKKKPDGCDEYSAPIYRYDLAEGSLDDDYFISVKNLTTIPIDVSKIAAKLKNERLDTILRLLNRFTAHLHYNGITNKVERKSIPVSGKVLDQEDLFNMIDASLDMWLTTGRFNDEFQNELARFHRVGHVLTTNSGSSANLLAISALTSHKLGERRLKEGDEVITVAAGFPTTINPIIQNKLVPVFVDIEIGSYNINAQQIEESITPRTKAIIVAHTMGNPFNINAVLEIANKHGLWIIEDNCDSLGSIYNNKYTGTFGHISTMSFYPAHHITTGEGGALIINDPQLYKIVMSFRDWGRDCWCDPGRENVCGNRFGRKFGLLPEGYDHKYVYSHIGYNLKMTDWQAAIGLSQLRKLPGFIKKRTVNFNLLYEGLKKFQDYLILPQPTENSQPSWFGFLVCLKDNTGFSKNDLTKYLENQKIGTRNLFAGNILCQPAIVMNPINMRIRNSDLISSDNIPAEYASKLANTEFVMKNAFWLGVAPMLNEEDINKIVECFEQYFLKGKQNV